MSKDAALEVVRRFGEARIGQGDRFTTARLDGHFFHETGEQKVAIVVWGEQENWTLSAFSCARVAMRPTFELYRYISRWRSTSGIGAPYVVEDGQAAVLCETTITGSQLAVDISAWRLITSTIDLVGRTAAVLARDLARADGVPFAAEGEVGLVAALSWWEVRDPHVERALGI